MPKGLKPTSGVIVVSSNQIESALSTFTSGKVDLQLNVLDREVFVVTAIDIDMLPPALKADDVTVVSGSISTTQRTTVGGLDNSNVLAAMKITTQSITGVGACTNYFQSTESPHAQLEYIGIIATNDFYLNVESARNDAPANMNARLWGFRAQADASTFAALTQSELLSA